MEEQEPRFRKVFVKRFQIGIHILHILIRDEASNEDIRTPVLHYWRQVIKWNRLPKIDRPMTQFSSQVMTEQKAQLVQLAFRQEEEDRQRI